MKKFAKLSLVAALAVAGTTASAQPLAEAIQNVDISGTVVYRYNDEGIKNNASADTTNNYYKVGINLSSKVNEDVKFNARILMDEDSTLGDNNGLQALNTSTTQDRNLNTELSVANFSYTGIANTTVTVGKQGLATPWSNAIDSDGGEQTGTGILAATTMGPVTAAAGYFNQTNISTDGKNLIVAALMGKFGPINAELWHLDIDEDLDTTFVAANTSFDLDGIKLGLDAKYATMDDDQNPSDKLGNWEVGMTAAMGIFKAGVEYAETDKDGDAIVNVLARNGQIGYNVRNDQINNESEMMTYYASAQVTPELNVMVRYDDLEDKSGVTTGDHSELWTQITYNMSKNLSTYVRFADGERDSEDYTAGRLQVEYKF